MFLGPSSVLLLVLVAVESYNDLENYWEEAPLRLELFKIGTKGRGKISFTRLNTIPVVPRPSALRPGGFRRPTTTPRPFRKRPTTGRPLQSLAMAPQVSMPQVPPIIRPRPTATTQPTTARPFDTTSDGLVTSNNPGTVQFPIIVPEINLPLFNQPQYPIFAGNPALGTANGQPYPNPLLSITNQSQSQPYLIDFPNQPNVPSNQDVSDTNISQVPFPATVEQRPPGIPELPPFMIAVSETPAFLFTNERPLPTPSDSQSEAQPPFVGPNVPPDPPKRPSSTNTDGSGGRPEESLAFPLARPPQTTVTSRPFRPRPRPPPPTRPAIVLPPASWISSNELPATQIPGTQLPATQIPGTQLPATQIPGTLLPSTQLSDTQIAGVELPSTQLPSAQPPFDSGPHIPPKPPAVPTMSTTSFGVNPPPPNDKPQRPLPPSRPILLNPLPLPNPPYQLTTTEKPSEIFKESSMTADGNYTFDFLVSNSVYRKEQGFLKRSLVYPDHLIHVKTGAYSFTSPEGSFHRVDFVADEYGYRAFESSY